MSATAAAAKAETRPGTIAERFVQARLEARAVDGYPGQIPQTMDQAYAVQEAAIALYPDEIVGWKVGSFPIHDGVFVHLAHEGETDVVVTQAA